MIIGLVRHYKVEKAFPGKFLVSYEEVKKWFDDYEFADIARPASSPDSEEWDECYCSPAKRALETAQNLHTHPKVSDDLNELNVLRLLDQKRKLPFIYWGILIRNKSLARHAMTIDFEKRIVRFVDQLLQKEVEKVLIVSHGFVMIYLQKELLKRGFASPKIRIPKHGKVYRFSHE